MLLVLVFHFGVMGLVMSELVITSAFAVILLRWFAPLIRPVFSRETLREVLRFGLPRVPHGLAQQVVGPDNRFVPDASAVARPAAGGHGSHRPLPGRRRASAWR